MYNEQHIAFGNTDKIFIQNELVIMWEYPGVNLPCKSMLDRIIVDHEKKKITIVDLKTTSFMSEFKDKALEYRYNRQMAFYWMAVYYYFKHELKLNIESYERETFIVAVSTKEPTEVKVFKVSDHVLGDGFDEIEQIIPDLAWHWKEQKWDYPRSYYDGEGYEIF